MPTYDAEHTVGLFNPDHPCYTPMLHAIYIIEKRVRNDPYFQMAPILVIERCLNEIAPDFTDEQRKTVIRVLNHRTDGGRLKDQYAAIVSKRLKSDRYFDKSVRVYAKKQQ